jgi:hypothetical protein
VNGSLAQRADPSPALGETGWGWLSRYFYSPPGPDRVAIDWLGAAHWPNGPGQWRGSCLGAFRRRPPERVEGSPLPASENLHRSGSSQRPFAGDLAP